MTDARAALNAYAGEIAMKVGAIPINRLEQAQKAFAALRAVLDYADDLDKVDLYAGPAHCLRTLVRTALEAS